MSSEYSLISLSSIASYSQGIQVKPEEQTIFRSSDDIRFIRIIDYTNNSEPPRFIKNPGPKYFVNQDDIVMIRYGSQTAGKVAKGISGVIANNMFKVTVDESIIDRGYLYRFLSLDSVFNYLRGTQSSSTMPAITFGMMDSITVPVPHLNEQKTIAQIFDELDNRIALLRETNATLESVAQALFKSWFVDFDPVRAKQQGQMPEGMDEATAALFPDSFEESELGLVPKGWQVKSLDEVATFLNGLALQKFPPEPDSSLPVIKIAQLRKGDTEDADKASGNLKPEYIVHDGDVLFSWSGSLEVEIWCGGDGALNQHLFKVSSNSFQKWFYYLWTKHHLANFRLIAASKATTMGHIQRKHLTDAKVLVPSAEVLKVANEILEPILQRVIVTAIQAKRLANLRDTLLPRLISGQLRLTDIDIEQSEPSL